MTLKGLKMTTKTDATAVPPDLSQCEAEPIHIPGSIQPHGVLLALHGPGVTPEDPDRVFDAFQQAASGAAATAPGMGVGLSLVSRFAELHDGAAWVEERPGGGASFRVFLPGHPGGYRAAASDGDGDSAASQA